ncbi:MULTISPECIES: superoxide dismutase family protein [unclassified Paenibacillus]|uniref:superoxide dismutase family protein n=1 Tax=unclassified Paenibacillus TaxID=185978 RepID=UPI001C123F08|nr:MULTISPECIES: superoxide dismutase family protein [unclassified Paenibacillus]MBU5443231.1 superoxide dismutase family protein [Paenibacillus sp. MSJ-34]CAH0121959.1 hypothetical protein PAE9249_04495 [Paenibacillus sp. CECT 9249]
MAKTAIKWFLACGFLLASIGAGASQAFADESMTKMKVNIIDGKGTKIGTARLTQAGAEVKIHIEASKLPPGEHGIHFHAVGRCDAPDFKTAEAHFNLQNKQHGFKNAHGFHEGDLPNLKVGANGKVKADLVTTTVTLQKGKPNSLLKPGGTALVIHANADDYTTDPSGNSGDRIACAIIKP